MYSAMVTIDNRIFRQVLTLVYEDWLLVPISWWEMNDFSQQRFYISAEFAVEEPLGIQEV